MVIKLQIEIEYENKCGRPTSFTEQEEQSFPEHIIFMVDYWFPIGKTDYHSIVKT